MNTSVPVAGVDVSKRFSDLCVLAPDNSILTQLKIYHDSTSMNRALTELRRVEREYGAAPVIVMESTSHYHLIVYQFFRDAGFEVIVVNPIQSGALKNIHIRNVKNDRVDAHKIAMLYRMKVLRTSQIPMGNLRGLRLLSRQRAELMRDAARFKNRLTAYLDSVFPGYGAIFSDIGGVSSRAVLSACPTPQALLQKTEDELAGLINSASKRGEHFCTKKAVRLIKAAKEAVRTGIPAPGSEAAISSVLDILESLLKNIHDIEKAMKELAEQDAYIWQNIALLQTIPGIGFHSSFVLLAEIGDFSMFHKPKQLAAYFGLDPSQRQSGTFYGSKNKLSKRGSPLARAALNMAALNSVAIQKNRPPCNPILAEYYRKKRESKPGKVALCALMRKISDLIFAVLRDQKPFELRLPAEHAQRLGMSV